MDLTDSTLSAPAPAAPPAAMPSAPVTPQAVPNSLAEFRSQKASSLASLTETPPPVKTEPPIAIDLDPPLVDEGDDSQPAQVAQPDATKGPEQDQRTWRWKDPDTGTVLDMRRKESKRIKRLLEERSDYARRLAAPPQAQPQQEPPQARQAPQPDASDPEPQLEDFAEQADPYGAHNRAVARWEARQEFKQLQTSQARVDRQRSVQRAITTAQEAYDAALPTVKQRYADFDDAHQDVMDTLARVHPQARTPIVQRLLTSPIGHDLTHYLGTHPDDLAAVASARSAYEQGLVLGAIETRVRALVNQRARGAAPHSTAPPPAAPMAPVGGGASPVTVPDMSKVNSLAQFRALKPKLGMRA